MEVFQLSRFERDQFPLSVVRAEAHQDYPEHTHDFTELVLVLKGEGIHVDARGEWPFRAGDIFVIEPGAVHSYRETKDFSLVNIMFHAGRLRLPDHDLQQLPGYHALFHLGPAARLRGASGNLRLDKDAMAQVDGLVEKLLAELGRRRPGYQAVSVALLVELVVFLSRRVEGVDSLGGEVKAIGKALGHIERHATESLSLDDLAKVAGMSVRNFQRRFKESVGVTPFRRLLEVRVERAKALLSDQSLTVSEVAFLCGFQDANYFCRQFRLVEGLPPGRFRKGAGPRRASRK